jgi:uncharacterized protein YbjQ (UPF0145 family)
MIISTIDFIPGKKVFAYKGFVKGATVQSKHIGKDFMAGLKTIVGGELKGYSEMLNQARDIAIERMVKEAEALGANAIIGMKLQSSMIMQGATEMIAYGTAVILEDEYLKG